EDDSYGNYVKVTTVDVLAAENAVLHHTAKYDGIEDGHLIIRRGQPFDIYVRFNGGFNPKRNKLRFVFKTGPDPKPGRGTHVQCAIADSIIPGEWCAILKSRPSREEAVVTVYTPANCVVSDWNLTVESIITHCGRHMAFKYNHPNPIYVLFNPWCKEDEVYFSITALLEEYILNDSGAIFHGNYKQIGAKPWFYGQVFEDGILEASLYCIQNGFNSTYGKAMADPVRVSRIISKIVNSIDDNGVLEGNWTSNYSGGTSPLHWGGSVAILEEYMETKKPVKYGQCFVFSGIVTTICRAIGIPCRSVTNFASAHDTDGSITIDMYWDLESREAVTGTGTGDSVWNFHCWNDAWMQRKDLPEGYGGWQVIDSTPQERSEGMFQCGPMSLRAVKEGKCELSFDGPFIFSEVNADRVNWARKSDGQWFILGTEKSALDITDQYKYLEESELERNAVISASRAAINKKPFYNTGKQDIEFGGFLDRDFIIIGKDFDIGIKVKNLSNESRTLEGKIVCETVSYTGERINIIKKQTFTSGLDPHQNGELLMNVFASEYLNKVTEQAAMKVSVVITVLETGQKHAEQDDFRLRTPDMHVENIHVKKTDMNIGAGELWTAILALKPKKPGRRQVTVSFHSAQVHNINGVTEVDITEGYTHL
ncbi:hypothetical protein KUTeg_019549, partial [Tegillarca granosa]